MDPLPSINKAYSMVLKFKQQKAVLRSMNENVESLVLLNKVQGQLQGRPRKFDSKKGHFSHCNMDGHVKERCFKLIRYPEWYKPKIKAAGQPDKQTKNLGNGNRIIVITEGSFLAEDNPLEAKTKIDELSAMLSNLQ